MEWLSARYSAPSASAAGYHAGSFLVVLFFSLIRKLLTLIPAYLFRSGVCLKKAFCFFTQALLLYLKKPETFIRNSFLTEFREIQKTD